LQVLDVSLTTLADLSGYARLEMQEDEMVCLNALIAQGRAQIAVVLAALALSAGCGGYSSSNNPMNYPATTTPTGQTAHATVNIGDSPSDRVVAFELTINSIVLTASNNTTVSVLTQPRRIELAHLSGTSEPLALLNIPEGTYTSAAIAVSAPDAVVITDSGNAVETNNATMSTTVTVNFSPALTVGAAPVVLTIDGNVANSLTINATTGAVTFNPTFTIVSKGLPVAGQEGDEDDDDGEIENIVGSVTAIQGTSFTIQVGQTGMSLTFATNANTRFEDVSSIAGLPMGAMVRVEGNTQQDGSLVATEVELLSNMAAEAEGFVSVTTGNPVSSFTLVLQDGAGTGINTLALGGNLTVSVNSSTGFKVDAGELDLSGLTLPAFSAATLSKGQRVEIDTSVPLAGATVAANAVKLEQEALVGTVSGLSGSQFTLTVADDSAFKILTGMNTISVIGAKNLQMSGSVGLANGNRVRVRGLLFFNSSSGGYQLIAGRVTTP
jgi:hypothetical protein